MATPLPKITYDAPETVAGIELVNTKLDTIREVIDTMSIRLNIKLGSMASMMSDFFDLQKTVPGNGDVRANNSLYSIDVKLGSLNMMIGEFFEEQRQRWAVQGLTDDNDKQVRPRRPNDKPDPSSSRGWKFGDVKDQAQSWFGKLLAAMGVALLAVDFGFDKLVQESGIAAFLVKGLTKLLVVGTGLASMFEKVGNLPVIKQIVGAVKGVINALDFVGSRVIPMWSTLTRMLGSMGKLIPFAALVTSVLDFMRGWSNTTGDWLEKTKGGIAEIASAWVGWPLDILKSIVSWVMDKFGFDTSWVDSFDFVSIVRDFTKGLFDFIHGIFTLDKSKFPEGLVNFTEWVTNLTINTVNSIIGWIKRTFDIGDPNIEFNFGEWILTKTFELVTFMRDIFKIDWAVLVEQGKTKISETVSGFLDDIKGYFKGLFTSIIDSLPSWDDIKRTILPTSWYKAGMDDTSLTSKIAEIDKTIADNKEWIKRSMAGENVYNGFESLGIGRSMTSIEEANRLRAELIKEKNARANKVGQAANINIVNGGASTVNNSSMNVNQYSSMPTSDRPDR